MSKKVMLITGASRGIGKAVYDRYVDEYEIITVHRSAGATIQGNLVDWQFREKVIKEVNPDVVINNAGFAGFSLWAIAVNGVAAAHLMLGFHKKMSRGHIITISSLAADFKGFEKMSGTYEGIAYICGKSMASSCSQQLANMRTKPVNVVCIEPGIVKTNMHPELNDPTYTDIDQWDNSVYTPLMPSDIVNTIDWALNQPPWININMIKLNTNSTLTK
jgi:NADP-dependent 3-hydroxy acid dehydrogenase YdfG